MSEYADPDLETVAPLPPLPPAPPAEPDAHHPPRRDRGPRAAFVVAIVVVSLVVGFLTATLVLDGRNSNDDRTAIAPTSPTTPATTIPGLGTPGSTVPATPADPDEGVLGGLIVQQKDVANANHVVLLDHGADLTVATLDLCNGTFASEKERTARRQVDVFDNQGVLHLSTEAILYGAAADGTQAFAELRSVAAHCPATPVPSPVGEPTVVTKFAPAPDGAWPRTPSVERLAYDFTSTDSTGSASRSVAVYLRRGRVLMGVYFAQPGGAQAAVDGRSTIAAIVAVFEARIAQLPARVTG